nr:MAG TPA: hypothetical protein [Caudoviricetes sp.]
MGAFLISKKEVKSFDNNQSQPTERTKRMRNTCFC